MTEPRFLLDSNICIYVLLDQAGASARAVTSQRVGSVVTSSIVYAEVMRGIPPSDTLALANARRFFEIIEPLPFDRAAADVCLAIPFRRGAYDRLIAAHAMSLGLTLITNNERDFADIPGLKIENWTL